MKKTLLLLVVSLAVTFTACNKTKTDTDAVRSFKKTTDLATLSKRVDVINQPIQWSNLKSTNLDPVSYNLTYRLHSLVLGGMDTLSASCVEADGNYVYVGFHNYSVGFGGEIATVDISGYPALVQSDVDIYADYNDMEIDRYKSSLWVAGENNARGAVILEVPLAAGLPTVGPTLEMPIFGASGNSISHVTNFAYTELWVSSAGTNSLGDTGGLIVLNAADPTEVLYQDALQNAKQFDATGDYGVLVYGDGSTTSSKVRVYNIANVYNYVEYTIPFTVTPYGKNAVDISQNFVYMAMGNDGVVKMDMLTGAITAVFDYNGAGLANGVKVDGTYVYVANGADGFFLLDKRDLSVVGHWDGDIDGDGDNSDGSCNYVDVQNDVIYLALGKGGLVVLNRI